MWALTERRVRITRCYVGRADRRMASRRVEDPARQQSGPSFRIGCVASEAVSDSGSGNGSESDPLAPVAAEMSADRDESPPSHRMRSQKSSVGLTRRPRGRKARVAVAVVKVVAALASVSVVVTSYFAWSTWTSFSHNIAQGAPIEAPTTSSGGPSASKAKDIDGPDRNILILGNDSRAGATPAELQALGTQDDGGSENTDTMMVMHVPGNGKNATIISFPRDSYVAIPGHGMNKLNAAYPDGYAAAKGRGASELQADSDGINLLGQTLQQLTGLTIDHYIQINLLGFYRISNAIKGVPVVLCQAQQESNSGINLPAGLSLIQGTQALAFVRQRDGLPLGDVDRIKRQQYFMKSTFRKLTDGGTLLNPFGIQNLLDAVSSSIVTDGVNLLDLANTFSEMAEGNINFQTIPYDNINGHNEAGSVILVTPAKVQAFVRNLVGVKAKTPGSATPTAGQPVKAGSSPGRAVGSGVASSSTATAAIAVGAGVPNVADQPGCVN
jgi:LCP family protein required for cell wall assembly